MAQVHKGVYLKAPKPVVFVFVVWFVLQFIKTAGDKGIDLLTFPEGIISGYPW